MAYEKQMPKDISKNQNQSVTQSAQQDIDSFLETVKATPPVNKGDRGRLIFALDATASRQATWDMAISLQSDMFIKTKGIGQLDVQLLFYRGHSECRSSKWINNTARLVELMQKVSCLAGRTQIERVLKHAIAETREQPVNALVFVGDCIEEPVDLLGDLAGQLKLLGLPMFIFQEGHDPAARQAFSQLARLSGGAHCQFDQNSASQLGQLLNAVAVYAAGGKSALKSLSGQSASAANMLEQLK